MSDDLIAAHREQPKLMPYLHLPFQAGADRILAAMNRKHTAADYLRLVARIRAARPDIALSTDIIVGFPGETEADFEATLEVVERVGFAQAYSFKYSPRPGTPGADHGGSGARRRQDRAAAPPAGSARPPANGVQFAAVSARLSRCCSSARAATRASSSAARPICKPFMQQQIRPCSGASWRLQSSAPTPIVSPVPSLRPSLFRRDAGSKRLC